MMSEQLLCVKRSLTYQWRSMTRVGGVASCKAKEQDRRSSSWRVCHCCFCTSFSFFGVSSGGVRARLFAVRASPTDAPCIRWDRGARGMVAWHAVVVMEAGLRRAVFDEREV